MSNIYLKITADPLADSDEIDRLTRSLYDELLALDIEAIERLPASDTPLGAKSGLAGIDWSTLLITLAGGSSILAAFAGVLKSWVERHKEARITLHLPDGAQITVEGDTVGDAQIDKMLDLMRAQTGPAQAATIEPAILREVDPEQPAASETPPAAGNQPAILREVDSEQPTEPKTPTAAGAELSTEEEDEQ